ncbi:DUF4184 family protein [Botryobacter ruber]|uniref:DUF4184 family protein n=1 Tax=Botryobacter ruber TaxID=2171629 RepID=UPI000E0A50FB|nr:DUF4184 family protein [Botryobacter ruber]
MPFTFSHPAIVLPLRLLPKKWVSLTGLVVGSVVPDFEKFIKMEPGNTISHTWTGLLWFNLPLGLLLCLVFHQLVRNPLVDHLPGFFRKRLNRFKSFRWIGYFRKNIPVVVASVLVGALSHLIWDSFTHKEGHLIQVFPGLSETIALAGLQVSTFGLLDHLSTLLGLFLLFWEFLKLPVGKVEKRSVKGVWMYWSFVVVTGFLVVVFRFMPDASGAGQFWDLLITSISALLIGLVVASFLIKYSVTA